jgi:peptidoglycan hydrolase-like protein with peptidoglycan-binding domain
VHEDASTGTTAPTNTSPRGRSRRGLRIRIGIAIAIVVTIVGIAVGQVIAQSADGKAGGADLTSATGSGADAPTTHASTTTIAPTTTTIPPLAQPAAAPLPPVPGGVARSGARGPEIAAYEQRLHDLHFDPGPVDGTFDAKTTYAVQAVEKMMGWPRTGTIDQQFVDTLANFQYPQPLRPQAEGDRVEIDLDRQVLTLYKGYQVALITTTSTGSGKKFCGGDDGCQYAITPAGRYVFQWHVKGWRDGSLGRLYNPWYFNGGIAVHGYTSVPATPASHGCARIPMHIAEYFGNLVYKGMAVYVLGTPAAPSGGPLPPPTAPKPATTTAPPPPPAPPVTPAPPASSTTASTTTTSTTTTTAAPSSVPST